MKELEKDFWALLRSGLWGGEVASGEFAALTDEGWKKLLGLSWASMVDGLVIDAAGRLPRELQPAEWLRTAMEERRAALEFEHGENNRVIAELMARFEEAGVHAVLLKGQGLAQCFREPTQRAIGDIDIYVGPDEMGRAVALLRESGMMEDEEDGPHHLKFHYRGKSIELHRYSTLMYDKRDREYQPWAQALLGGTTDGFRVSEGGSIGQEGQWVATPPLEFNAYYLFHHTLRHFTERAPRIRQFCDWARFLYVHYEEIDREALRGMLERMGELEAWQKLACFLVGTLGMPRERVPFYSDRFQREARLIRRRFEKMSLGGRAAFIVRHKPRQFLLTKSYSLFFHLLDTLPLLRIFPSVALRSLAEIVKRNFSHSLANLADSR